MNDKNTSVNIQTNDAGVEEQSSPQQLFCCQCGTKLKPGSKFCTNCGQSVDGGDGGDVCGASIPQAHQQAPEPQNEPAASVSSPQQPQNVASVPAAQTESRSCSHCGNTLAPNSKYCIECGVEVLGKAKAEYRLVCKAEGNFHEFDLKPEEHINIGKSENCKVMLADDDYVSRMHARIYVKDGCVYLEDLNSSNGTFTRIDHPVLLKPGSQFVIGKRLLVFERNNSD